MRPAGPARVRALSIHACYRCRDSGACCSSGWEIEGVRSCVVASDPTLRTASQEPPLVLTHDATGRCVFLEGEPDATRCRIHRGLGPEALPSACRQFPRVTTLTPSGACVTLSHYCPTAAALLFQEPQGGVRIVEDAPAFPPDWPYEGLDAGRALPPLRRPGALASWKALERWEAHAVATLTGRGLSTEEAVASLAAQAEAARRWTPAEGDFDAFFLRVLETDLGEAPPPFASDDLQWWDLAASTVPQTHPRPRRPEGAAETEAGRLVAAGWSSLEAPVGRWLASKAFASWLALQGDGLRTTALGVRLALSVLRAEAAGSCAAAGRALDRGLLTEAVRRADLLLLHLSDPAGLARRLSRSERGGVLGSNLRG